MVMTETSALLTIAEVAARLNVSRQTVRRMIRSRELQTLRFGLVGDLFERHPPPEHRVDPSPPLLVTSVAEPMCEPDVVPGEVTSVHLESRIVQLAPSGLSLLNVSLAPPATGAPRAKRAPNLPARPFRDRRNYAGRFARIPVAVRVSTSLAVSRRQPPFVVARPVTPEVAGSSPVAPAENILQITMFCCQDRREGPPAFSRVPLKFRTTQEMPICRHFPPIDPAVWRLYPARELGPVAKLAICAVRNVPPRHAAPAVGPSLSRAIFEGLAERFPEERRVCSELAAR
jgi:excisionase family DNA binding protein